MQEIQEKTKDQVVAVKQADQKKVKFIGSLRPHKGHTLYEVNLVTGDVEKAKFEPQVASFEGKKQPKRVNVKKDCIYVSALNVKNLIKKLKKSGVIS